MDENNIGSRIKSLRQALNQSQNAFASALGVSGNYLWMIEKGKRPAPDRLTSDISRIFGVDLIWLRTGVGEMFKPQTREEALAEIFARAQIDDDDRSRLLRAMAQLPDEYLPIFVKGLEKICKILSEDK